jgi:hypothetical protein
MSYFTALASQDNSIAVVSFEAGDLSTTVTIPGEPPAIYQAIHRQWTHHVYRVGQIVYLSRHFAGDRWVPLSIPKAGAP